MKPFCVVSQPALQLVMVTLATRAPLACSSVAKDFSMGTSVKR